MNRYMRPGLRHISSLRMRTEFGLASLHCSSLESIYVTSTDSDQLISLHLSPHYENTPIQICRKFHLQKTENI